MATAATPAVSGAKAGFWIRVVAYIIDAIILVIVTTVLAGLFRGNTSARGGIQLLLGLIYFVYFWSAMSPWPGQTPGLKILNLRVIRTDGSNLDLVQAVIRYVGLIIASIPIGLGLAWVGWDPNKQGWHDKIASTYVVKV